MINYKIILFISFILIMSTIDAQDIQLNSSLHIKGTGFYSIEYQGDIINTSNNTSEISLNIFTDITNKEKI